MQPGTLLLMYHAVLAQDARTPPMDPQDRRYAVTQADFCQQLDLLAQSQRYAFPPLSDIAIVCLHSYDKNKQGKTPLVLTFDDSWREHATVTAGILQERQIPAIFFLTTDQIGQPGMMTWDDARSLAKQGFSVGSHGKTHRFLDSLSETQLREELHASREALQQALGIEVRTLSLPGGRGGTRELKLARETGYTMVFGSTPGLWQREADGIVPRCVIDTPTGNERIREFCTAPEAQLKRLERTARQRAVVRRLLGNRFYHFLHGLISRCTAGKREHE